jgi:CHAT domain-containing protein/tetratricopeptide (TPR) repeat protein
MPGPYGSLESVDNCIAVVWAIDCVSSSHRSAAAAAKEPLTVTDSLAVRAYKWVLLIALVSILCQPASSQGWQNLLLQSDSLYRERLYDSAIMAAHSAFDVALSQDSSNYAAFGRIRHALGRSHWYRGNIDSAEYEFSQELQLYRQQPSADSTLLAGALNALGTLYQYRGDFVRAEPLLTEGLAVIRQTKGEDNAIYAATLGSLAYVHEELGELCSADSMLQRALRIRLSVLPPNDPSVATNYDQIGTIRLLQGDYESAVDYFRKALSILDNVEPPDLARQSSALQNLASVYNEIGEFNAAESLLTLSVALLNPGAGTSSPDYAIALYGLGNTYLSEGDYDRAEQNLKESWRLLEEMYGPDYFSLADVLNTLGGLYDNLGQYDLARTIYSRSIRIRELNQGPEHIDLAANLNNLGNLEMELGNLRVADSLFSRCIELREKSNDSGTVQLAVAMENLANVRIRLTQYQSADSIVARAISLLTAKCGIDHPAVARMQAILAHAMFHEGMVDTAETTFQDALHKLQDFYGSAHSDIADCLESIRNFYRDRGLYTQAFQWSLQAFSMRQTLFTSNAYFLAEADALRYAKTVKSCAAMCASIFLDLSDTERWAAANDMARIILLTKGSVSDMIFRRQKALMASDDSNVASLLAAFKHDKFRLAALLVGSGTELSARDYHAQVDSLKSRLRDIESQMGRQSRMLAAGLDQQLLSVHSTTSSIPQATALLDYYRFDYTSPTSNKVSQKYLVALFAPGMTPSIVNLGGCVTTDSLVRSFREHLHSIAEKPTMPTAKDRETCIAIARECYTHIVAPLADQIAAMSVLLVAPDGPLNLLPFHALVNDSGRYLIEQMDIQYISAGRDVVAQESQSLPGSGVLALADPDFDWAGDEHASGAGDASDDGPHPSTPRATPTSDSPHANRWHVARLHNTRSEVEHLRDRWMSKASESVVLCLDTMASEASLRRLAKGKRVIYLATHGFFLDMDGKTWSGDETTLSYVGENPLLSSGLLLAGCNRQLLSSSSDDGVLTALEVSALDLRGVELAVLSACETGLGMVESGEGVYGLRRAFQMAGASTVVSTLWPVSDAFSDDMMSRLSSPSTHGAAAGLREVELAQLRRLRAAGLADHPYLWAGFVAQIAGPQ